jgi:xylitol oxidase
MRNWAGNIDFGSTRVHRPESIDELRRIVADSTRVRAVGSGHSFSGVLHAAGDLVGLDRLPREIDIDAAAGTVTVGAGMRYADVAVALHQKGFALANLASLPDITVGGACATGTHGSGDTQRVLAGSVVGLQVVGPEGDLTELREDVDRDTFAGSVVALGALGVVTRLTLAIEPSFDVAQTVHQAVALDDVQGHLDDVFGAGYSVSVFTDWHDERVSVWTKRRADRPAPELPFGAAASGPAHPVPGVSPDSCTTQLGVAGPWHERLPHFRAGAVAPLGDELQSEFFVPRQAAPAAIAAIRDLGETVSPVLQISEVRTIRGDDLWLSPAFGRDSVAFHFTWVKDMARVLPVISAVEERLAPLGARGHWGKLTTMSGPEIASGYRRAQDFLNLMEKFDPDGKFSNGFTAALFASSPR